MYKYIIITIVALFISVGAYAGSVTKGLIGKEDMAIQANTEGFPTETYERSGHAGGSVELRKLPDWYRYFPAMTNARNYGDGSFSQATVTAALAAILASTGDGLLFEAGTWPITQDTTFPSGTHVVFAPGASFLISEGVTLTLNCSFESYSSPETKTFEGPGNIAINDTAILVGEDTFSNGGNVVINSSNLLIVDSISRHEDGATLSYTNPSSSSDLADEFTQDGGILVGTGAGTFTEETPGTTVQAYDPFLNFIAALTDPGADRIPIWDETTNSIVWATPGTSLEISGTTINVSDFIPVDTVEPDTPVDGELYHPDNDNWDPCNIPGTVPYVCVYDGADYVALWDDDGSWFLESIAAKAVITSSATTINLVDSDFGKIISMTADSTEVGLPDCDADSIGGFITIFVRDAAEQVEVVMYGDTTNDYFILSDGTALDADDEADLPTTGNQKFCFMCVEANKWHVWSEDAAVTDGGVAN